MTPNFLEGDLKHSAHERLDTLVGNKDDDSDDELVNAVRSILYFCWTTVPLKMPSFRLQDLHALAHQRGPHRLAGHLAVSPINLHLQHPPNNLPIPSGYSRPRYLSGYSPYWAPRPHSMRTCLSEMAQESDPILAPGSQSSIYTASVLVSVRERDAGRCAAYMWCCELCWVQGQARSAVGRSLWVQPER
jgi:hypothetical protein